ncbi:MAG: AbrB/MazE/SpoVT family DNA-binding domain-containing protein [Beijerinckiaceae bacterium]
MSGATVTTKGQLTIPVDIRNAFGIEPGHRLLFFKRLDGELGVKLIRPRKGAGYGKLADFANQKGAVLDRSAIGDAVAEGVTARGKSNSGLAR